MRHAASLIEEKFMTKQLHVLIVEDSENDTLLLLNELQRGGYDAVHERVASTAEMDAALDRRPWELVLADYSMPQFNGAAALRLIRERGLDIPFIIVSGAIGEDAAVTMMKAGADDYVMKDQLARLIPAVERELTASREREARRRSEQAMVHLAAIVAHSDDAIFSKTLNGTILSWNAAAERIYGYAAEEMIGRSASVLVPPNLTHEFNELITKILRGDGVVRYETIRLRKDRRQIHVSLTVSPIRDREDNVVGVSTIARDVTEQRQQQEEHLRLIQDLSDALAQVKTLRGLLPICAWCKKIRDDRGYWQQVEFYVEDHSLAEFTHGICPECKKKATPQYAEGKGPQTSPA
jgi:PAS domain S-box-containing protein